jgi:hypothetical protein
MFLKNNFFEKLFASQCQGNKIIPDLSDNQ